MDLRDVEGKRAFNRREDEKGKIGRKRSNDNCVTTPIQFAETRRYESGVLLPSALFIAYSRQSSSVERDYLLSERDYFSLSLSLSHVIFDNRN